MPKEQPINKDKSSISGATSYQEMSEFWDEHSLTDYWDMTESVEFEVNLETDDFYYKIAPNIANKINLLAQKRGVSAEDLINSWVREKLQSEMV